MKQGYVAILLDETGSMAGQEDRVVGGINEYLNTLKADTDTEYGVALKLFDSERWRKFFEGSLAECPEMTREDYRPGMRTPLYDAIARVLTETEEKCGTRQVLVLVDTDGYENASKEHTMESIKARIKEVEDRGWTFVFLASGLDVAAAHGVATQAQAMGISGQSTMSTSHGMRDAAYGATASATVRRFAEGPQASTEPFYTDDEKAGVEK